MMKRMMPESKLMSNFKVGDEVSFMGVCIELNVNGYAEREKTVRHKRFGIVTGYTPWHYLHILEKDSGSTEDLPPSTLKLTGRSYPEIAMFLGAEKE